MKNGSGVKPDDGMPQAIDELASENSNGEIDPEYISAGVSIRLKDGRKIHIHGL